MANPTPSQVLVWDISGLPATAANAQATGDAILKAADTMHSTIHDFLIWKGKAKDAAEGKADREQAEMRAIVTSFDDLAKACTSAHNEMGTPLSAIKQILQCYAHPPIAVGDDWKVTGLTDQNSEAAQQLARLPGLLATLLAADSKWGQQIGFAIDEIESSAPVSAVTKETADIQKIKKSDPKAVSDSIAKNPTSFWAPDWPATTAAAIIGAKTEITRQIMESIAKDGHNDGYLKWVEDLSFKDGKIDAGLSRLGIFGGAISTIPAIADDIHDGMNPIEAAVSEGTGTGVSLVAGGLASSAVVGALGEAGGEAAGEVAGVVAGAEVGASAGSVVPVLGTAAGLVVGGVVGWAAPKIIQWAW